MSTRPYLGINVNAASVEEMHFRGLIEEGETMLALFDGVLLDDKRRRVGGLALCDFVALTDRRVVTWARGFFNDTVDSFEWKNVDVVQAETWDPWHGRVSLAFRLPSVAPRKRRIAVNGSFEEPGSDERLVMNTLDYMPLDDVSTFAHMVELIGDKIVEGVSAEELIAAFVEAFPVLEREPLQPFFTNPEPMPPSAEPPMPPAEVQAKRKRWWQVGSEADAQPAMDPPVTPGNLIAAYETQRNGAPAGSGISMSPPPSGPMGVMPMMSEQPSMYEISRSLRLVLEAPRKLARGIRRATEAVGGANELVSGLQDPRVRRNAMRGLYQTAAQHEAEGGPLAPVGPVVRAAVRFAEPVEDEQSDQQQSRRIQVRASVRKASAPPTVEPVADPPIPRVVRQAPAVEPSTHPEPVRRSIAVRRVEPPVEAPVASEAPPAVEQTRTAPVRRIAVNRPERVAPDAALTGSPKVVSYNGNGVHHPDERE